MLIGVGPLIHGSLQTSRQQFFFFVPKYGNTRHGTYMFTSMWHVLNKCWSENGGRCQGANGRRQAHHVFSIMVSSLYYSIESELEIKTMALGVGSVTTLSFFS
jgi:hypothetical protein